MSVQACKDPLDLVEPLCTLESLLTLPSFISIGMLVGTFAVCVWRVAVLKRAALPCRSSCRQSAHRAAARSEASFDDEKAALMTDEEEHLDQDSDVESKQSPA